MVGFRYIVVYILHTGDNKDGNDDDDDVLMMMIIIIIMITKHVFNN